MNRFRLNVESLGDRALPSAVVPASDASPVDPALPAQAAQVAESATGQTETGRVVFSDLLVSKVSMQDFHFVMKMSKASPK